MTGLFRLIAIFALLTGPIALVAAQDASFSAEGTEQCLGCHDFGPEAPVHAVMAGSHGDTGNPEEMAGRRGCEDCHGPSADHTKAPTRVAPGISFGPRWTATSADQDSQCLACHEDNIAKHWRDALHMVNNLTCVTCHDIHAEEDRVLFEKQQAEVCTVCHKAQKQGIHGMQRRASRNPPCTECHNPHDHESAQEEMLRNHSAGCSQCHDLVRMASRSSVSDKAKSYHKVMARPGSTCLQCHEGIAHAPADSVPPMQPVPRSNRRITLFYPGMADSDWLLQTHPGSQPLRQGTNCQRCHRGDEGQMGASLGGTVEPTARDVNVNFAIEDNTLLLTLEWQGPEDDASIAVMWGGPGSEALRRGGCFAACHSDMPGMSKDRRQRVSKYLGVSRAQVQRIGQPAIHRSDEELQQLMAEGQFAELWRVRLQDNVVERSLMLAESSLATTELISIKKSYDNGRWHVALKRLMDDTEGGVQFTVGSKYTFGIALNGARNPAAGHWVSLPMTLSFGGDGTDFTAK